MLWENNGDILDFLIGEVPSSQQKSRMSPLFWSTWHIGLLHGLVGSHLLQSMSFQYE